ncbi:hypothetical protein [Labilibaculum antarcticum]|uniref:Outer membrane protein beta-barrel domain-containing protein n=1 Tax=Labilibaculum antarcticum TaxID=1717717 RepID=A0A1Y1CKJ3_9BACT|nr:hypothetical protein [Labilibaculum antarcticum]BAX80865.1 hypothetical protein ALGA_2543 [Labilibaculum antarcticum]
MKTFTVLIKSIAILALMMFTVTCALAQKKVDVVTLKNGNVLKGKIVRQVPGKFVEIETKDKNFWQFDMEDIADIRFEAKRLPKIAKDTLPIKNEGMFYEVRMGALIGNKDNKNNAPFSMLLSGSYLFENGVSFGIGGGYEAYDVAQMPLFGEIKYYTTMKGIKSFLFCQSGYSFALEDKDDQNYYLNGANDIDSKGGWLINPGVGFVFGNSANTNFTLNIGYRFQKMEQKWHNTYTDDTEYLRHEINRLSIHLGLIF